MTCAGDSSDFHRADSGVRQWYANAALLSTLATIGYWTKSLIKVFAGHLLAKPRSSILFLADGARLLAEPLKVLVTALEVLQEEAKPLGLELS